MKMEIVMGSSIWYSRGYRRTSSKSEIASELKGKVLTDENKKKAKKE